ncbi:hypothetical protein GALMADRAFT_267684 [Galerina marginata CBS 339.88]|uniref:Uncharacterized protein n=1 Tax=Galerina marginata (strain CBS 339.88) TaxID=685588 RepID=A0A067TCS5_GALM3|nr:hypothetical protein GALMADRAFT_267684 [Galerina marginata CBS 339.88]
MLFHSVEDPLFFVIFGLKHETQIPSFKASFPPQSFSGAAGLIISVISRMRPPRRFVVWRQASTTCSRLFINVHCYHLVAGTIVPPPQNESKSKTHCCRLATRLVALLVFYLCACRRRNSPRSPLPPRPSLFHPILLHPNCPSILPIQPPQHHILPSS